MAFKLVIWDLDNTFWNGTLSEGKVEPIEQNINIVKCLTDRGIMNSIVSKNDAEEVNKVLIDWGIKDYFIFSSVSWEPKGERVKQLLLDCGLRAENVLFIDDNESNLAEVKYYNPQITCVFADYFQKNSIYDLEEFRGKEDTVHSRLKQYHEMEKRIIKSKEYSSNEDFLRDSHIKVTICKDCENNIDRIDELVQRTNQLNYTKNRMNRADLNLLLNNKGTKAAYVKASDDYCDYGIIGFFLLHDSKLIHFLFSCRVLGLGIENYIYRRIGCPSLEKKGEVAVELDKDKKIDYITEEDDIKNKNTDDNSQLRDRLLLIGGCDLESASKYLKSRFIVDREFNTVINGHEIRTSDTMQLVHARELDNKVKEELCNKLPFMHSTVTYSTRLYSGKYNVIVISLIDDYIRGTFKKIGDDFSITWGSYWDYKNELEKSFSVEELEYFNRNFEFSGKESAEVFKENLEKIINNIEGKVRLVFINGVDLDVSEWIGSDRIKRNIEMNRVIDEIVKKYPEIGLVDMRDIVLSKDQLPQKDNRHYDRQTYYRIAQEIVRLSNGYTSAPLRLNNFKTINFTDKIERKMSRIKNKIKNSFDNMICKRN